MDIKDIVILGFWIVAITLFFLVGFRLWEPSDYQLVAIGLGLWLSGSLLNKYWKVS